MVRLTINKHGNLSAEQWATRPIVYLDHWALRKFSEDERLAASFVSALEARDGTLALSWLNLCEFSKVTSREQARQAEMFLESSLPRVFLIEVEPSKVISREDALFVGAADDPPPADLDFLRVLFALRPPPHDLQLPTAHDLFRVMQNPGLAKRFEDFADTVVTRISSLRVQLRADPQLRSAVARVPAAQRAQIAPRLALRELVRTLLIDGGTKLTRNHAIDLIHAVVPICYCDLVLIDKHWETQVARVRTRLSRAGISLPVAQIFSGKANGINRFLTELASWTPRGS